MKINSLVVNALGTPGYRILTYTSKNEFFVIDVSKNKQIRAAPTQSKLNHSSASRILSTSQVNDIGISTTDLDPEEEAHPHNFDSGEGSKS